jgi:hypothetical protein
MSDEPEFPHGKKYPDDEGAFEIQIAADPEQDVVRLDFGKPIRWLALEPTEALQLATLIAKKALELQIKPPPPPPAEAA